MRTIFGIVTVITVMLLIAAVAAKKIPAALQPFIQFSLLFLQFFQDRLRLNTCPR